MSMMMELLTSVFERRYRPLLRGDEDKLSIIDLIERLAATTGEDSKIILATQILDSFEVMDDDNKLEFFVHLAVKMDVNTKLAEEKLIAYRSHPSKKTYQQYMKAVEPDRQELIRRLNQVPGATEKLVKMRADLLRLKSQSDVLDVLDLDFRHLFVSWFNRGFLVLRPINWETPANILEKIIAYEAVHEIYSWEDLRRRMQPKDRCCFGFFHLSMPDEPLIFVEVALTQGIANSVQDILKDTRDEIPVSDTDTAVFYSISNCQKGLSGITFGNSLIKQVAAELSLKYSNLKTFVTLSPIPGLMKWLESSSIKLDDSILDDMRPIAAHYLLKEKALNGKPLDPVARFHLGNGARVHALHNNADISQKGIDQSGKAMVNYLYDFKTVSKNHEKFSATGYVSASQEVLKLSKNAKNSLEIDNV